MARITKEPEVRKQEILETAMAVFYEKGYDKTKMSDIADKIGIAQGLCYRYFPSKEVLFDSAIEEYAHMMTAPMIGIICDKSLTLKQKLERFPNFLNIEKQNDTYYQFFHDNNNKKIHDQLSMKICEIMQPYVAAAIKLAHEKGETAITDYDTVASFTVYGQLGILLDNKLDGNEKIERIRTALSSFISK